MSDDNAPHQQAANFTAEYVKATHEADLRRPYSGSGVGSTPGGHSAVMAMTMIGATLGLLLGRDQRILTAIVFAVILGGATWLIKTALGLIGRLFR